MYVNCFPVLIFLLAAVLTASAEQDALKKADACLNAGLYEQAVQLYAQVAQPEVHLHRAQAYFKLEKYSEARAALEQLRALSPYAKMPNEALYLAALCCKHLGQYQEAADYLTQYLAGRSDDLARFQLGLVYFLWEKPEAAVQHFLPLSLSAPKSQVQVLASLYLAKIYLQQGNEAEAGAVLQGLQQKIPKEDPLKYEFSFLMGKLSLKKNQPEVAIYHFSNSLPAKSAERCSWACEAFYQLGLSYLSACRLEKREELLREQFDKAEQAFKKSLELKQDERVWLALGQCYLMRAHCFKENNDYRLTDNSVEAIQAALKSVTELMEGCPTLWRTMESPEEIPYLRGLYAAKLADMQKEEQYVELADRSFRQAADFPHTPLGAGALLHLAALYYRKGDYPAAEKVYLELVDRYPDSPLCGEAWHWAACCADQSEQGKELAKARRQKVFSCYPASPYAAEAYFAFYTLQEYLQGEREAVKHLLNFVKNYQDTPLLSLAYYLIGLDYKRDRRTPEGKWIRKKSLTEAIDAFQQAEQHSEAYRQLEDYRVVRARATLERARCNLAIAEESQGAKKQIYLQYAEEVLKTLTAELKNNPSLEAIFEESAYWLAQTCLKQEGDEEVDRLLSEMMEYYRQKNVAHGYYLSRILYEQGRRAMQRQEHGRALQLFDRAQEAAKGDLLSTDQRLDLWIQQSQCLRAMRQLEEAILLLSKAVNDDAISSLRLKAMYLRAELYELQGRPELARKQLESIARKGGAWAQKAKERLEERYGY